MRVQDGGVMTAVLAGTEGIVTSDERDNIKAPGWDGGIGDATGGDGPASLFGVPKGFRLASAGSPTRAGSSNNASTSGNPGLLSKLTGYSNSAVNWQGVQERLSIGDTVGAFAHVVDRGELADLARMMEVVGPRPYLLSASVRNRVYDGIATMLVQDPTGPHTERCLFWVLALLRGTPATAGAPGAGDVRGSLGSSLGGMLPGGGADNGANLALALGGGAGLSSANALCSTLAGHTKRDLKDALVKAGQEKTKRGLLAALLTRYFA
jgi:hypothetical protein